MRRRLDIAMSLIGNPPVIFLDEPTAGLDPQARIEVWQAVKELAEGGTTVLLTTQYPDKADIWTALAWCAGILAVAYTFANIAYRRRIS